MFSYTKEAFNKTIADIRGALYFVNIAAQSLYIGYLIYAICVGAGIPWVNIALLSISVLYFGFYLFTIKKSDKSTKHIKFATRHTYKVIKIFLTTITLATTVYSIYVASASHMTPMATILATLSIISWIIQISLELIVYFVEIHIQLIIAGLEADRDNITKPVRAVGDFVMKLAGKEPAPQKEPSRLRRFLDKKVLARKEKKKEKQEFKPQDDELVTK